MLISAVMRRTKKDFAQDCFLSDRSDGGYFDHGGIGSASFTSLADIAKGGPDASYTMRPFHYIAQCTFSNKGPIAFSAFMKAIQRSRVSLYFDLCKTPVFCIYYCCYPTFPPPCLSQFFLKKKTNSFTSSFQVITF